MLAPWKKSHDKPRQHIKKQRHYFADKGPYSQSYGFSSSHIWMWELDHEEGWTRRINAFELWCWRRLLRVPWTARRSNQSILKEISPEHSLEGLMLKLKLQSLCHPDAKNWLTGKDPDAGNDWRQEEKGTTEDRMVGWHHWLNGHKFEQTPGDGKRHGSLVCCSSWGCKESDTTLANEQQLSISQSDTFIAGGDEEKHTEESPSGSSWEKHQESVSFLRAALKPWALALPPAPWVESMASSTSEYAGSVHGSREFQLLRKLLLPLSSAMIFLKCRPALRGLKYIPDRNHLGFWLRPEWGKDGWKDIKDQSDLVMMLSNYVCALG